MYGIVAWCVLGLIAGAIARFLVPGEDPMGWLATMALGLIGSIVGGFLGSLVFHGIGTLHPGGLVASVLGAVIVLLLYRRYARPK